MPAELWRLAEQCNGLDDDCDGTVDENLDPPPELGVYNSASAPVMGHRDAQAPTVWMLYPDSYEAVR